MDENNFKNKYLKYKNKYLELKKIDNDEIKQDGGGRIIATYICFYTDPIKKIIIGKTKSGDNITLDKPEFDRWTDKISSRGFFKIGPKNQPTKFRGVSEGVNIDLSFLLSKADFHYCSIKSGLYPYSIDELSKLSKISYLKNNILRVGNSTTTIPPTTPTTTTPPTTATPLTTATTPTTPTPIQKMMGNPIILPNNYSGNNTFGSFDKNVLGFGKGNNITKAENLFNILSKDSQSPNIFNNIIVDDLQNLIKYCNLYNTSFNDCGIATAKSKTITTIIIVNSDILSVSGSDAIYQIYSVTSDTGNTGNDCTLKLSPHVSENGNGGYEYSIIPNIPIK